jgi:hypothetical protein
VTGTFSNRERHRLVSVLLTYEVAYGTFVDVYQLGCGVVHTHGVAFNPRLTPSNSSFGS